MGERVMGTLEAIEVAEDELASYAYSYPHKSSYRPFDAPIELATFWHGEPRDALALYVHIPFCEMRCGFCNLFTQSQPRHEHVETYLSTLTRQIRAVRRQVGASTIQFFAVGGGTPTLLSAEQLARLFVEIERTFEFDVRSVPTSVETSPATALPDRLRVLADFGVKRISIGIQSFDALELSRIGRPQDREAACRALHQIREFDFPILNIDLMYGDPRQSVDVWRQSIADALRFAPEEIYIYPLYVRPQTGLANVGRSADYRRDLYRAGRELLGEAGYDQVSLRCFRRPRSNDAVDYSCQSDGMIGLGCGARSYTSEWHYASRFAVTQPGIQAILTDWIHQSDRDLCLATHGIRLNEDEKRRRFLILSLLQAEGLRNSDYDDRFRSSPDADFPEILELIRRGWVHQDGSRFILTECGMENSDTVGPLLYSNAVLSRLREFVRL